MHRSAPAQAPAHPHLAIFCCTCRLVHVLPPAAPCITAASRACPPAPCHARHLVTHCLQCRQGTGIKKGQELRLQHVATRRWLHSHLFASPLSNNQEVRHAGVGRVGGVLGQAGGWQGGCGSRAKRSTAPGMICLHAAQPTAECLPPMPACRDRAHEHAASMPAPAHPPTFLCRCRALAMTPPATQATCGAWSGTRRSHTGCGTQW